MMLCDRLYKLREAEALDKEPVQSDFSQLFNQNGIRRTPAHNPFASQNKNNPFANPGYNPFK